MRWATDYLPDEPDLLQAGQLRAHSRVLVAIVHQYDLLPPQSVLSIDDVYR